MAIPDLFTDVLKASPLVTERTGGLAPTDLQVRLEASTGVAPDGTIVYRPYYVAADLLLNRPTQVKSAEGVVFRDVEKTATDLFRTQHSIDQRYDLYVPAPVSAKVAMDAQPGFVSVMLKGSW